MKACSGGENCPGARSVKGINDSVTLKPEIMQEWSEKNKIKPTEVSIGSHKKVIWKCKTYGNEWYTLISTRSGGSKCPYCSGYTFLKGFNDLAILFFSDNKAGSGNTAS